MPKGSKRRAKRAKRRAERRAVQEVAPAPTKRDDLLARIRREAWLRHEGRAERMREEALRLERRAARGATRPDDEG